MVEENRRKIASHPSQRKLWYLRKFYAGNGGALPPTDPRILAMTEAQIDIDFQHMLLDKEEREEASGEKVYVDTSYEEEEAEEERMDRVLYVESYDDFDDDDQLPKSEDDNEQWVDIEDDEEEWEEDEMDEEGPSEEDDF